MTPPHRGYYNRKAGQCPAVLRGVAQLVARVVWDHEAAGSSPVTSIEENHLRTRVFRWFLFVIPQLIPHLFQPRRGMSPHQEKGAISVACNSIGSRTLWKFAGFTREGMVCREVQRLKKWVFLSSTCLLLLSAWDIGCLHSLFEVVTVHHLFNRHNPR